MEFQKVRFFVDDISNSASRLTTAFQPRRLMIAPAAVGCKRLLRVDVV